MKRKAAFTLIELLIVIIIVGVLAGIGMPLFFRNAERAQGAEALNILGTIKRLQDACAMQYDGDRTNCNTWDAIGMSDPNTANNSHFSYTLGVPGEVTATRNSRDSGGMAADYIRFNADGTKEATGVFAGIVQ